jgi:translation elongation factor EF-Tu-like GTPase
MGSGEAAFGAPHPMVVGVGLFKRRSRDLFTIPEDGRARSGTEPAAGSGFRMVVDDVFVITGRGAVVTGMVGSGVVTVGSRVTIERDGRPPLAADVAGIEMFRKTVNRAGTGDNVGLLFRGLTRTDIVTGDVIRT